MLFLLLLVIVVILWFTYTRYQSGYWSRRGVPHDKPMPIIGSMWPILSFKQPPGLLFKDLYYHPNAKNAPVFGFHIFGKPAILLRDPEIIKQIIIKDFNYFSDRFSYVSADHDYLAARNLFFIKGNHWRALRVTLTPTFTSKRMKEMYPLVTKCANDLIYILKQEKETKLIGFTEIIARCAIDVILSCAFGVDGGCLTDENSLFRKHGKSIFEYKTLRNLRIYSVFFAPHSLTNLLRSDLITKQATGFLNALFWDVIETRKNNGNKRNDLIDVLIDLQDKGEISTSALKKDEQMMVKLDGKDLLAQATAYFAAGFETTSSTISFALDELSRSPIAQQKTRQEIQMAIKKFGSINYEAINEMPYLDQVISETLRLYPPLPFLDRHVNQNYQIPNSNITLEKGTPIYISLDGLHNDPQYFPKPEIFDPDRFNESNKVSRPAYVYMPFGDGPRNCIGARFGLMVAKCVLSNLLNNFEIIPDASKGLKPPERKVNTFLTQAKNGIHLYIKKLN